MGKDESRVHGSRLYEECVRAGCRDLDKAKEICKYVEKGADIGCEGEGRLLTRARNDQSVEEYGVRVADMIQSWLELGMGIPVSVNAGIDPAIYVTVMSSTRKWVRRPTLTMCISILRS